MVNTPIILVIDPHYYFEMMRLKRPMSHILQKSRLYTFLGMYAEENSSQQCNLNSPQPIDVTLLSSRCFGAKYIDPGEDVWLHRCRFAPVLAQVHFVILQQLVFKAFSQNDRAENYQFIFYAYCEKEALYRYKGRRRGCKRLGESI